MRWLENAVERIDVAVVGAGPDGADLATGRALEASLTWTEAPQLIAYRGFFGSPGARTPIVSRTAAVNRCDDSVAHRCVLAFASSASYWPFNANTDFSSGNSRNTCPALVQSNCSGGNVCNFTAGVGSSTSRSQRFIQ